MKFRNIRVLVTGSTGFIGANITRRLLKEGSRVSIFTRRDSNIWRIKDVLKDIENHIVDLADREGLDRAIRRIRPDVIIHTAAYGGYPFQKDADKMIATNLIGTVNLLNACDRGGFRFFLNTGSSSEYGTKDNPMKEGDVLMPETEYGVSKASATLYCQAQAKKRKLPIATLRLFSPYGYFEDPSRLVSSVILSCLDSETVRLSSPGNVRDFIFIEDAIDAYLAAIDNCGRVAGEILNIGSGRQYTIADVADKIIKLTGSKSRVEYGQENPRLEPKVWRADISKAKDLLKWRPANDLDIGLTKTIAWFKENKAYYAEKKS